MQRIPLTDRGFRYGTERLRNPCCASRQDSLLEQHLAALHAACADVLDSEPRRSKLSLRWKASPTVCFVSMSQPGTEPSASAFDCRTFALFEPAEFPQPEEGRGVRIGISQEPSFAVIGGWKTGNYWPRVKALARAEKWFGRGPHAEFGGRCARASMANVFFVFGSRVRTPPLASAGALRGSQGMGHGNDAG